MAKKVVLLFILLNVSTVSFAQFFSNVVYNRKAVYAEFLGNSLGASLNYEYLYRDNGLKQGFRFGPGYFVNFFENNKPTVLSANFEYLAFAGARDHHVEWGLGATFQYKYYKSNFQTPNYYIYNNNADTTITYTDHTYKYQRTGPAIVPRIGYRYETPDGGLLIRVAYTPLLYLFNTEKEFVDGSRTSKTTTTFKPNFAWGGISIGFSFY